MNLKARATALDQLIDSRPSSPAQFATAGQGLGIRLNGLGNGLCWLQMACTTSSPLSAVNYFAFAGGVEGSWMTMGDTILYIALRSNLIQIVIGNNVCNSTDFEAMLSNWYENTKWDIQVPYVISIAIK